jgi:hypothetical protein
MAPDSSDAPGVGAAIPASTRHPIVFAALIARAGVAVQPGRLPRLVTAAVDGHPAADRCLPRRAVDSIWPARRPGQPQPQDCQPEQGEGGSRRPRRPVRPGRRLDPARSVPGGGRTTYRCPALTSQAGAVSRPHSGVRAATHADGCVGCTPKAPKRPATQLRMGRPPRVAMGR